MNEVRDQFPALLRGVAYFDAPGGTQVPRAVADAMTDYLLHHNANTHWAYPTSEETDAILAGAREAVAGFLNASPGEIAFGNNMTTITFHVARALGRTWRRGDEVIVTDLDHHANVAPWRALERDFGVVVRSARFIRETFELDWEHLESLVSGRTKLLAIGGASNAVGTINDLARAKSIGVPLYVDAVHLAPHELIDVKAIGCDFLACSSYKFYGPHAGILFAREDLMQALPFPKLSPSPDTAPERAETGTQNHEGIAGIAATIEFLASIGEMPLTPASPTLSPRGGERVNDRTAAELGRASLNDAVDPFPLARRSGERVAEGRVRRRLARTYALLHDEGRVFAQMLWDGLSSMPRVTLYGPPPNRPRTPTVAFTVDGIGSTDVVRALAKEGVYASHGDFYAETVIERIGVGPEGVVRAGCACYTTEAEVERLLSGLSRAIDEMM